MGQLGSGLRSIQWDLAKLPVFEKNFYIEHPAVSNRPESASADWRKSKEITIIGKGIPKPVFSFEEASMPGNEHATTIRINLYKDNSSLSISQNMSYVRFSNKDSLRVSNRHTFPECLFGICVVFFYLI